MFQTSQLLAIPLLSVLLFDWAEEPSTPPAKEPAPVVVKIPACPEMQALEMLAGLRATLQRLDK
jgi:hypothetical protein